jgi:mRNA-degrading endonuclease RelE of RelBE toxin-antitoxin system
MPHEIMQIPLFERQFKKLPHNQKALIVQEIEKLMDYPPAEHHLAGILRCCSALELLRIPGNFRIVIRTLKEQSMVRLIAVGPHRNTYGDAERYIQKTGV